MKALTFRGGVHPRYNKDRTAGVKTALLAPPNEVVIPMTQHIGAPAKPVVEAGAQVLVGQVVGEPVGFVSAFIHSSVSGKVKAVEPRPSMSGVPAMSVVIENDSQDSAAPMKGRGENWGKASKDELKELVRRGGLVGMGGAAFPTHVKLSPPPDKGIDTVILNGAECEPFLTSDHRLMLERPKAVVEGCRIAMAILGAAQGVIGIEANKLDAIGAMTEAVKGTSIRVQPLEIKYPQGAEKQLIDAILGREVPSGGLPMDARVVVQNVGTAAAIADAVIDGKPLYERVVTVTGSAIKEAKNLIVRVGTPVTHIVEACGGVSGELGKLICGGPMMGNAQHTDLVPVTKGTSGLLFLCPAEVDTRPADPCIRCGRCVRACPMRLMPTELAKLSAVGRTSESEAFGILDCIECGSCSYECPSRLPLVQEIRLGKSAIHAARRKQSKK
ncbi:MAG: electron transport complex subunit RsxC [Myxococcota bacterium]|jgi:electron transport complex protein RnfC|nr:electron transport complex subunit RsxC [Myxococcota bacterium]